MRKVSAQRQQPLKTVLPPAKARKPVSALNPSLKARIGHEFAVRTAEEMFERMLWTWNLRLEQSINAPTLAGCTNQELEERFGDGHLPDRRKLIQTVIILLSRHKIGLLPRIFTILLIARQHAAMQSLSRYKILADRERRSKPETRLCRRLVKALVDYRTHRLTWDIHQPKVNPPIESPVIVQIDLLVELLGSDHDVPRLTRGAKRLLAAEWARDKLSKLGLPSGLKGFRETLRDKRLHGTPCEAKVRNLREALLMGVGLIPYRTRPDWEL